MLAARATVRTHLCCFALGHKVTAWQNPALSCSTVLSAAANVTRANSSRSFALSTRTHKMTKRVRDDEHDIVLYSYWRSSCSFRVRIALAHKRVPYEYKAINLLKGEESSPEFLSINPSGLVPAMVVKGVPMTQSLAILEYLEERYPEEPLLPRSFGQRALVRQICNMIVSGIQPLQNLGVLNAIAQKFGNEHKMPWGKEVITEGLQPVEAILKTSAGKCCVGDDLTMADLCLVPQIYNARRFSVDMNAFPTIVRVMAHLEQHPSVQEAHPDSMPDAQK